MILGIGVDMIKIERIRQIRQRYPRFDQRIFTDNEVSYCSSRANPDFNLSARFAAKEAIAKALGIGIGQEISWKDIEVVNMPSGQPAISFLGNGKRILQNKKIKKIHLSLTHEKDYALAFCLVEGK